VRSAPDRPRRELERRRRSPAALAGIALLVLLLPLWLALFVPIWLIVVAWLFVVLQLATALTWLPRGRRVVFVYSNSPVWRDYIEQTLLPRLPPTAVVLNWSERRSWPFWSLAVWLFNVYGGRREFNPIALVVRPLRVPRRFRFWRAFRDFKHGKPAALHAVEKEFFDYIGA